MLSNVQLLVTWRPDFCVIFVLLTNNCMTIVNLSTRGSDFHLDSKTSGPVRYILFSVDVQVHPVNARMPAHQERDLHSIKLLLVLHIYPYLRQETFAEQRSQERPGCQQLAAQIACA
jgi:hypothetical protein